LEANLSSFTGSDKVEGKEQAKKLSYWSYLFVLACLYLPFSFCALPIARTIQNIFTAMSVSKPTKAESANETAAMVTISVLSVNSKHQSTETFFKLERTTRMEKLMKALCKYIYSKGEYQLKAIILSIDEGGAHIEGDATANSLGLAGDEKLFARLVSREPMLFTPLHALVDGCLSYAITVNMKVAGTLGNKDSIVIE
jgi:hypothetical protein